jgi:hypothetical protein
MTDDTHLDGNSLGGLLKDLFGREMTHHRGCCDLCGSISHLGTLVAYRDAPGDVARCPNCGTVVMVAVSRRPAPADLKEPVLNRSRGDVGSARDRRPEMLLQQLGA